MARIGTKRRICILKVEGGRLVFERLRMIFCKCFICTSYCD